MTSRERVQRALAHEPADRVPIFMWYHPATARRLGELLEVPPSCVGEAMGDDITQAWVNNNYAMEGIVHEHDGESHLDPWGIEWTRLGGFNQITRCPLAGASEEAIRDYVFPEDAVEGLLANLERVAARREDFFTGVDVSPCAFEMYWRLRGMEHTLLDFVQAPEMAADLLRRCGDFAVMLSERALDRYPVDWLWTGDDVAGQTSLMMSPEQWRDLVRPHLARVVEVGKARGLPVAYHCCGALRPIVPDLVELGIGVLNPIQCNCPGMGAADLKAEFGSKVTFMGGVDTQGMLPNGSEFEVQRATHKLIETMTADGGGFILAASHTVPPETPDRNIFAMYAAAGITREMICDRAADIRAREED